jgi:hypothetical protein
VELGPGGFPEAEEGRPGATVPLWKGLWEREEVALVLLGLCVAVGLTEEERGLVVPLGVVLSV